MYQEDGQPREGNRDRIGAGGRHAAGWLENEVLTALWAAGEPMTPAMVQEVLPRELAYTTVMTVLHRLHIKGLVDRQRSGRAFAYQRVIDAAELAARQMRSALDRGRSRAAVLQRVVAGLSADDERVLHELLGGGWGAHRRRCRRRPCHRARPGGPFRRPPARAAPDLVTLLSRPRIYYVEWYLGRRRG